jgi:WD40 repeat protein
VVRTLRGHKGPVFCVDISPDGKRLVSGGADWTVRLWDLETGKELTYLDGHGGGVLDVAFSPDGKRILSAGSAGFLDPKLSHERPWQPGGDSSIRLWDATTGTLIHTMAGHTTMVRSVAFSKDGSRALSAGEDATVRLWDLETGTELFCDKRHTDGVFLAGFSTTSSGVVSAGHDGLIWMRDLPDSSHEHRIRYQNNPNSLRNLNPNHVGAISPDGRKVVIAYQTWFLHHEGILHVWDLGKGREESVLQWASGGSTHGTFLPGGRRVLWGAADGSLHLYRLPR